MEPSDPIEIQNKSNQQRQYKKKKKNVAAIRSEIQQLNELHYKHRNDKRVNNYKNANYNYMNNTLPKDLSIVYDPMISPGEIRFLKQAVANKLIAQLQPYFFKMNPTQ